MLKRHWKTPSPALVISLIALFVALGGTTYAATSLPRSSVGAKQLKKGAVTPPKVSKKTIALFKGQTGPRGATGAPGAKGDTGPIGPSNAYFKTTAGASASVSVPAGSYVAYGQGLFDAVSSASTASESCVLQQNGLGLPSGAAAASGQTYIPANLASADALNPVSGVIHLAAPGTIGIVCFAAANTNSESSSITAIQVGTASP
jgi:hypothetical protein